MYIRSYTSYLPKEMNDGSMAQSIDERENPVPEQEKKRTTTMCSPLTSCQY